MRDEHGMEPISGIFSSPEKSPPKRPASARRTEGNMTNSESESMDIQESTWATGLDHLERVLLLVLIH